MGIHVKQNWLVVYYSRIYWKVKVGHEITGGKCKWVPNKYYSAHQLLKKNTKTTRIKYFNIKKTKVVGKLNTIAVVHATPVSRTVTCPLFLVKKHVSWLVHVLAGGNFITKNIRKYINSTSIPVKSSILWLMKMGYTGPRISRAVNSKVNWAAEEITQHEFVLVLFTSDDIPRRACSLIEVVRFP